MERHLKPEYVDDMTVDEPTAIKHKAACVWKLLGSDYTPDQLTRYCALYGISIPDALRWKSQWNHPAL